MSDIQAKVNELNRLLVEIRAYKAAHPESRVGYYHSIPSLLNAYREGDVGFDECVALLREVCAAKASVASPCDLF